MRTWRTAAVRVATGGVFGFGAACLPVGGARALCPPVPQLPPILASTQAGLGVETRKSIKDRNGVFVAMRFDIASSPFERVVAQRHGTDARKLAFDFGSTRLRRRHALNRLDCRDRRRSFGSAGCEPRRQDRQSEKEDGCAHRRFPLSSVAFHWRPRRRPRIRGRRRDRRAPVLPSRPSRRPGRKR